MSADLVAFLRARLDDDERLAQQAADNRGLKGVHLTAAIWLHLERFNGVRVGREVAAKRAIVEEAVVAAAEENNDYTAGRAEALGQVLCLLALPYADHRDYRMEWKP